MFPGGTRLTKDALQTALHRGLDLAWFARALADSRPGFPLPPGSYFPDERRLLDQWVRASTTGVGWRHRNYALAAAVEAYACFVAHDWLLEHRRNPAVCRLLEAAGRERRK